MSAWIDVYCHAADVRLDVDAMLHELERADLMTLAEHLDLPEGEEAAVEEMWRYLRLVRVEDTVNVCWRHGGRPMQLRVVRGADAAAHVTALKDQLPPSDDAGARRVLAHLSRTTSIVNIDMALDDANHLGATVGEVLAFFIAELGDGLIYFYGRDWASPTDRASSLWAVGV